MEPERRPLEEDSSLQRVPFRDSIACNSRPIPHRRLQAVPGEAQKQIVRGPAVAEHLALVSPYTWYLFSLIVVGSEPPINRYSQ